MAPGVETALGGLKTGALVKSAGWKVVGLASSPPVDFREERSLAIVLMPMSGAGGGGTEEEVLAEKLGGVAMGVVMGGTCGIGGVMGIIGLGATGDIGGTTGGGGGGTEELAGVTAGETGGLYSLLSGKGAGPCRLSWLPFILV